jgi:hypothetical protein
MAWPKSSYHFSPKPKRLTTKEQLLILCINELVK